MTAAQLTVVLILAGTIALFIWGRWRHDMVATAALLATVAAGLVPAEQAFAGFAEPAVITVACVLVLSHGLQSTGAIDALVQRVLPKGAGPTLALTVLTLLATALSAVMNNVAALALLMPLAVQLARRHEIAPGRVLMPLAFASLLGGTMTLIGTPPNQIVAGFRAQTSGAAFGMFDFTPVGLAIAAVGTAFLLLAGRRLVPAREGAASDRFEIAAYLTEARVAERSKIAGKRLRQIERMLEEIDAQIVGMIRDDAQIAAPAPQTRIRAGDILVVEAEPEALARALARLGIELEEAVALTAHRGPGDAARATESADSPVGAAPEARSGEVEEPEIELVELAVLPGSGLVGRSASQVRLRSRFAVNLLAIAREGQRSAARLRSTLIRAGDVLLLQGAPEAISEVAARFGCVPLAARPLRIPEPRRAMLAVAIMLAAILLAALGIAPPAVAFTAGALAAMASRVVPPRAAYQAIDWPVVVLLGAMAPLAAAMSSTGTANLLARWIVESVAGGSFPMALAAILIVTMILTDFMNNAATAALMAPLAIGTARTLEVSADPLLMAVAVGCSCSFLTPIGHQNNTLILGPGGLRFTDYWRLGLPLAIVVLLTAILLLPLVWPP